MKHKMNHRFSTTAGKMSGLILLMTAFSAIVSCGKSTQKSNDGTNTTQTQATSCNATDTDICGPFSQELIALCKSNGGGNACDTNRWNKAFYSRLKGQAGDVGLSTSTQTTGLDAQVGESFGQRFASYYRSNYNSIYDEVGITEDACAYFVSSALSRSGISVSPKEGWAQNVSSRLRDLGWQKVTDYQSLIPGDVVFTYDGETMDPNSEYYGVSPHVFVFDGYGNSRHEGLAIDNQGNGYLRNLGLGSKSPFWYAYRKK
jgi:hypothetical protein